MGYASHEGKAWALEQMKKHDLDPETFLDVGAGAGSWMECLRPHYLESSWIALEVWHPYVERFCLWERYKMVIERDARTCPFPGVDVVILGDVLEHMKLEEAIVVWAKAMKAAGTLVVMSTPIIPYPQGHVHGNPYQEHESEWDWAQVQSLFPGITDFIVGKTVGTFLAWR